MDSLDRWFGGTLGNLSQAEAVLAAEMADELVKDYSEDDWMYAIVEGIEHTGV